MCKRLTHHVSAVVLLGVCLVLPVTPAAGANFALDFANDRVDIPYIGTGVSFAEISLEAWVYWRGHTSSEGTSGILEGRGSTLHWQINANNNVRIRLEGLDQNASANVQQNEWFHLAVTYSRATQALLCYKNGTVYHTGSGNSNTDTFWTSGFAQFGTSHRGGDRRWNGMIDEMCIWNKVRTQAQIQDNMKNGLLGTEAGLIANWKLNEGEGTVAHDSSPNKHHGTVVGARWVNLDIASAPTPADKAIGVTMPLLQWKPAAKAIFHNVYFGTTPDLTEANLVAKNQPFAMYFYVPGLQPGVTYYWRVDQIEADLVTIHKGDVWSFTAEPLTAFAPTPADGAGNLMPAPTLSWLPGKAAIKHRVYFSGNQAEVESGAAAANKGDLTDKTFKPGVLRASTTYYWRVDEIKADGSVEKGPVWSFTTQDGVAKKIVRQWWNGIGGTALSALTGSPNFPNNPTGSELVDAFEGPTNVADNYGSRLYGWLTPPETADYTFWMASDDFGELRLSTDADPANAKVIANVPGWTNSREWTKYPAQKSAPIKLEAGKKYYIEVLMKEGGGGDNVAVSWQGGKIAAQEIISAQYVDTFALPPLTAYSPSPANGAVDAPQSGALSWSAGEKAQKHDVYFGDDKAAVAAADSKSPLFKGSQTGTTFNAGALEWGKTYYWRVDEVNPAEAASPWKGSVWSFTTATFLSVDDMESYTDAEGNRIYEIWTDGWTNKTGSTVGNLVAPFAERTIVHGGKQSMPLDYNNAKSPFYSEAELAFAPQQNWTTNGVTDLSLWFRGNPVRFVDKGNGAFTI
ncbi:MAG: hypothetical protein FJ280_23870, partial [Planctomycetes bacterium]|nr:hypothetical protein [Planctomycetota bacterium]